MIVISFNSVEYKIKRHSCDSVLDFDLCGKLDSYLSNCAADNSIKLPRSAGKILWLKLWYIIHIYQHLVSFDAKQD